MDGCVIQPRYLLAKCSHGGHHNPRGHRAAGGQPAQPHTIALSQLQAQAGQECNGGSTAPRKGTHISFAADARVTLPPSLLPVPRTLRIKQLGEILRVSPLKLL